MQGAHLGPLSFELLQSLGSLGSFLHGLVVEQQLPIGVDLQGSGKIERCAVVYIHLVAGLKMLGTLGGL